jgi:hypothetical protein
MIIDVMRADHLRALHATCARVLGSLLIFRVEARMRQTLGKRAPQLLPRAVRKPLHELFSLAWRGYLPIQPRWKRLPPK